jgi:uncharacterized protein (DUF2249 family)
MPKNPSQIDARQYAPKDKRKAIDRTFEALNPGEKMELINDYDPKPLYHLFNSEIPNKFSWEYLEEGPEVWRVAIEKK